MVVNGCIKLNDSFIYLLTFTDIQIVLLTCGTVCHKIETEALRKHLLEVVFYIAVALVFC